MSVKINNENFTNEVLNETKTVLVDFWATWCGPCKMIAPILEEIADENSDIKVCKINVDEEDELSAKFGIMSIPTLIIFQNGKVHNKVVGLRSKEDLLSLCK